MHNLGAGIGLARVSNAVATGTTNVNCNSYDMVNSFGGPYDGIMAIVAMNALTATQQTILKLQGSNDNATWLDLAGTHQGPPNDNASGGLLVVDVFRPQCRFVRPVVQRGTAAAVLDAVIVIPYNAHSQPVSTQDATVAVPVTGGSGQTGAGAAGVPINLIAYPVMGANTA